MNLQGEKSMISCDYFKVIVSVIFLPFFLYADGSVEVRLSHQQELPQPYGKSLRQTINLSNNLNRYDIGIVSEIRDGKRVKARVGIENPNHSLFWRDFMRLAVKGNYVDDYPLTNMQLIEEKNRGGIELTYDLPEGKVRCRLLLYPDDEMLYVEWALDEKVNGEKTVEITCLPAVLNIIPGQTELETQRAVKTAASLIKQGSIRQVDLTEENWALLMDLVWDISAESKRASSLRGGVTGPAGIVFEPLSGVRATYKVAYENDAFIRIKAEYPQQPNVIRLAVCEFRTLGNEAAVSAMEARVSDVVRRMEKMVTTPPELIELDAETARPGVMKMLAQLQERGIRYDGKIMERMQRFVSAREDWEKERNRRPVSSELSLQEACDGYSLELGRLNRYARRGGKVLVVRGLYSTLYKINPVSKKYPLLLSDVRDSYLRRDFNYGFYLDYFPRTDKEIMGYDVIILADVDVEALREDGMELFCRYLENGGGLIVLGGYYSYGLSSVYETRLGEALPVQSRIFDLNPAGDFSADRVPEKMAGLPLVPARAEGPLTKGLRWESAPSSLWQHNVAPKQGAEVYIYAGAQPFLITGKYGDGRIACFAGTVLGEPAEGVMPFWEWESWPELLGRVIAWAAGKTPE